MDVQAWHPHRIRKIARLAVAVLAISVLPACTDPPVNAPPASSAPAPEFSPIDWMDLIPADELENYRLGVAFAVSRVDHSVEQRPAQFGSFKTVPSMNGRKVALQGYIVPLDTDDHGLMTSFFFVPTLGACIHVPPPPPDQMIYVSLSDPVTAPEYGESSWLKGTLRTEAQNLQLASAAYSMRDPVISP
jgi:hypothetical protein